MENKEIIRDELGRYVKGSGGKPYGASAGRNKAVQAIDDLMKKEENVRLFEKAIQERFENNPVGFFVKIIMPLIPREMVIRMFETTKITEDITVTVIDEFKKIPIEDRIAFLRGETGKPEKAVRKRADRGKAEELVQEQERAA